MRKKERCRKVDAQAVLDHAKLLGIVLRVEEGRIRYRPKSAAPVEFVDTLREHKPQVMALLQAQANALPKGYRLKYSDAQAIGEELGEIVARVHGEGCVLLWSTVLQDLIAFYRDEEARSKIPPGFVPYSEAELKELFGEGKPPLSTSALRLIHEAKKHGGRVVDNEAI